MIKLLENKPSVAGHYCIDVEGVMFCFAQFLYFDGNEWEQIPEHFNDRKIWWYDDESKILNGIN